MQMSAPRLRRTPRKRALLALLAATASCDSGDSSTVVGPGPGPTPVFASSGTPPATGLVRLTNPVNLGGGQMSIDVVIDGQILGADVFCFIFDIIMSDPAIVDFLGNLTSVGNALDSGPANAFGAQGVNGPDAAAIIGVCLQSPPGDADIPALSQVIATLVFQVKAVGTSNLTFAGANPPPAGAACGTTPLPTALDSTCALIPQATISFDPAVAMISGT